MIRRGFALLPAVITLLAGAAPLAAAGGEALVPIPACRAVDTRGATNPLGGPALAANEVRLLPIAGTCGIPADALGLAVNLTVVSPAATGFAQLYAGDAAAPPPTSVLNFTAGVTRAGNALVALASDGSGTVALVNASAGTADFLVDVVGYFKPACTATITVTNPATATGTVTVPFSQTFTSSGGTGTMTYTTASPLPAGLALAANGTLAGTPTQSGTFPIVVVATDANGCTGAGPTYTLVIACQTITVTNPAVTTGTVNVPFSQTFTQTGGAGTTTFSTASPLPNGLSLASNGLLAGTPTQSGGFPIVVVATDANGCTGTGASYLLVINCPPVVVSITPTPVQVCSTSAGNTASATPGFSSYAWSITNGTIQGSTTGASISYTAGASGNVGLTVAVMDAAACPGQTTLNVPITAVPSPPVIAAGNPQTFTVAGAAGTFTLTFNGQTTAPLAFNATAAAVQAALGALSSVGGVGGTVAVSQAGGVYTVTFGATLAGPQPSLTAAGAGGCTVAVDPPAVCADSTGNLARGPAGATAWAWVITNGTITSAANVQTITYTAGPSGTVKLDLTVTNPGGCTAQNSLDVTINAVPATPVITPTPSPVCGNSTGNTASGPAGATTYAWSITNGTITSAADAQTITYTAGPLGSVTLDLTVTNASGCQASNSLDVPINAAPATPTITPTPAALCANTSGNGATGPAGATTYAWSITNGTITSATNTQTITYTAGSSGNVGLTLAVTNANGCSASNTVNVPINPIPAFTPAAGALPTATHNTAYGLTFAGTGGTGPYSFALASGALPAGMTLTSGGTVTPNVPTATGAFSFSITVTDSKGCSSTQAYTLNVQPNLQPDAYSGVGNTQLFITGVAGAPTTPAVTSGTSVLANDTPAGGIAVTAGTTACGGIGGSLTIDSLGRFIYTPPVGATGLATCGYTGTSNTIAAAGAINITLSGLVWYVDNATLSGTNDGRSNTPFKTMTAVGGAATSNGDFIYAAKGSGPTTGAYTMKPSQQLIGAGATLNVPTVSPILTVAGNAANTPTLSGTLTLANTVTVNGIDVSTGSSTAITGTSISGVTVTPRDVTTTTATAVSLTNVDTSTFTFHSVSAGTGGSGPASGISLTNVNATSGSFTVTGNGANDASGGLIQNATTGVSLVNVKGVSFTSLKIQNTTQSGVNGTGVTDFSFVNGTIDNSGTSGGAGATWSNIAFNSSPATANNIAGTLTVTGSTLTNAFFSGVDVQSGSGTVSNATVSNNTITSSSSAASSLGQGINFVGIGSASATFSLTKATITGNTIANFPSGAGIQVNLSSANASGPGTTAGIPGDATNIVSITGNTIHGFSAAVPMNTSAIIYAVSGANPGSRSRGNADISNNGTALNPLTNMVGTAILVGINGNTTATVTTNNNVVVANNSFGSQGIGGGNGIVSSTSETPDLTWIIQNNSIGATDGNGILAVSRGVTGSLKAKIQNNVVAAPLTGVRPGIRVDAGNAASVDDAVCLNISGNTSAGSGGVQGIGLRKQGTVSTTNDFGVNGMAATASPGVETYVNGLNPAGGGTILLSATSGFSNCSLP